MRKPADRELRQSAAMDLLRLPQNYCLRNSIVVEEPRVETRNPTMGSEVYRVITSVCEKVESEERLREVSDALQEVAATTSGDFESILQSVFETQIGVDCPTSRILRTLRQNLIMIASYHIKYHVTKDLATKDVSGYNGWQVIISIGPNLINVRHVKREQSIPSEGPENYFWFEWQLSMNFNKDMDTLHSCSLRVSDLWINNDMNEKRRDQLLRRFAGGRLLVC